MYEYLITVGAEVELFWTRKITGATVLFLTNRYLVLFYNLSLLRDLWPFTLSVSFLFVALPAQLTRTLAIEVHIPFDPVFLLLKHSLSAALNGQTGHEPWRFYATFLGAVSVYFLPATGLQLTAFPAFSALRVFALTDRNWLVALIVFLLSMAPVGINFVRPITWFKMNCHSE